MNEPPFSWTIEEAWQWLIHVPYVGFVLLVVLGWYVLICGFVFILALIEGFASSRAKP